MKIKILYSLFYILSPIVTFAQEVNTNLYPCDGPDCNFSHLILLAQGLSKELFKYAIILSVGVLAYVGYLLITSQDAPAKRKEAFGIFKNVVYGLVIMMSAWLLVSLFTNALLDPSITGDKNFPIAKP